MKNEALHDGELEALERRVYRDYHQDGIWDLFLGSYFLVEGLLFLYSSSSYAGIYAGIAIIVAYQLKQRVTVPRIGLVNFSPKRLRRERRGLGALASALVVIFCVGVGGYYIAWNLGDGFANFDARFLLGLVFVPVLMLVAWQYGISRYYLHAAIIVAIFTAAKLLAVDMPLAFVLTGTVITICGATLLVRFVKKYPPVASAA